MNVLQRFDLLFRQNFNNGKGNFTEKRFTQMFDPRSERMFSRRKN